MPAWNPTQQQTDILDAVATGEDVVVDALAGSGKTSTLELIARARSGVKMTYAAFNRSIADDAAGRFPRNVVARTAHSFAYRYVMTARPELALRLQNQERVPRWKVAQILGVPGEFSYGTQRLRNGQLAGVVMEALGRFCSSSAPEPSKLHFPRVPGLDRPDAAEALEELLFPFLLDAWEDVSADRGRLRFDHSVYLKLASMDPGFRLPGEVVLFDEAQDADGVVLHIVRRMQEEHGAQVIAVGDSNQQVYAWRNAIDSLGKFETRYRLPLTKSWRFGPAIADEANRILSLLPTELRVEGNDAVASALAELATPDVVLCRTNAEAVARLLTAQVAGISTGLVGGTQQVEWLAQAALDLTEGRLTDHPELRAFETWAMVQKYVEEDHEARDLQVLVRIVDRYGPERLLEAVHAAVPEASAALLLSTAHKSKGREWSRVALAGDFDTPLGERGELLHEELRLAYVAVTRAQNYVDSSSLDWIDFMVAPEDLGEREFLPADQVPAPAAARRRMSEVAQVMVDPDSEHRVIITGTKYDPDLVEAQRGLPSDLRPSYRGEYAGFTKVRVVNAGYKVLQLAEKFNLTIAPDARERIDNYS